jgi:hypothetical protein
MLWKALAVICAGADCCFWRFSEGIGAAWTLEALMIMASFDWCFDGVLGFTYQGVM